MVYFQIEEPVFPVEEVAARLLQDTVVTGTGNYEGNCLIFLAPANNAVEGVAPVKETYDLKGQDNCLGDNKYFTSFCNDNGDSTYTAASDSW